MSTVKVGPWNVRNKIFTSVLPSSPPPPSPVPVDITTAAAVGAVVDGVRTKASQRAHCQCDRLARER